MKWDRIVRIIASDPKYQELLDLGDKIVSAVSRENAENLISGSGGAPQIEEEAELFRQKMVALGLEAPYDWNGCYESIIRPLHHFRVRRSL